MEKNVTWRKLPEIVSKQVNESPPKVVPECREPLAVLNGGLIVVLQENIELKLFFCEIRCIWNELHLF